MKLLTEDVWSTKKGDVVKSYKTKGMSKFSDTRMTQGMKQDEEVIIQGGIIERSLNSYGGRIINLYFPESWEYPYNRKSFGEKESKRLFLSKKDYGKEVRVHKFVFPMDTKIKFYRIEE